MFNPSWRNYDDPVEPDNEEDWEDEDDLAELPPQEGFDNELWQDRQ